MCVHGLLKKKRCVCTDPKRLDVKALAYSIWNKKIGCEVTRAKAHEPN